MHLAIQEYYIYYTAFSIQVLDRSFRSVKLADRDEGELCQSRELRSPSHMHRTSFFVGDVTFNKCGTVRFLFASVCLAFSTGAHSRSNLLWYYTIFCHVINEKGYFLLVVFKKTGDQSIESFIHRPLLYIILRLCLYHNCCAMKMSTMSV